MALPGQLGRKRGFLSGKHLVVDQVLRYHANLFFRKGATRDTCIDPHVKHTATVHETSMKCGVQSFTKTKKETGSIRSGIALKLLDLHQQSCYNVFFAGSHIRIEYIYISIYLYLNKFKHIFDLTIHISNS